MPVRQAERLPGDLSESKDIRFSPGTRFLEKGGSNLCNH